MTREIKRGEKGNNLGVPRNRQQYEIRCSSVSEERMKPSLMIRKSNLQMPDEEILDNDPQPLTRFDSSVSGLNSGEKEEKRKKKGKAATQDWRNPLARIACTRSSGWFLYRQTEGGRERGGKGRKIERKKKKICMNQRRGLGEKK